MNHFIHLTQIETNVLCTIIFMECVILSLHLNHFPFTSVVFFTVFSVSCFRFTLYITVFL